MDDLNATDLRRRLLIAGTLLGVIYAVGTGGYYLLGGPYSGGTWTLGDCAYMTVISLTTVGYGETLMGLNDVPYARLFTAILLVSGMGIALYFVSVLTTYLVEGEFVNYQRRRRMAKRIKKMKDHIILCGIGRTGRHVLTELIASKWDFVAVDTDEVQLDKLAEIHGKRVVKLAGDATDDNVLLEAGIRRAHGIVACLPNDTDNLYVVISSRDLNPRLRIVSKAVEPAAVRKLRMAGADQVVEVNTIGGLRLASEMIRPNVTSFLDKMLRDTDKSLRFEECTIPGTSPLVDHRLMESGLRTERNLLIVAARHKDDDKFVYSPGGDFMLRAGMTLILLGETESVMRLRKSDLFASD